MSRMPDGYWYSNGPVAFHDVSFQKAFITRRLLKHATTLGIIEYSHDFT